jgi:hypothetical protein
MKGGIVTAAGLFEIRTQFPITAQKQCAPTIVHIYSILDSLQHIKVLSVCQLGYYEISEIFA